MNWIDIPLAVNIFSALFSLFFMVKAAILSKNGRVVYVIISAVLLYFAIAYSFILFFRVPIGTLTMIIIRAPASLLLSVPAILYLMREAPWIRKV
jgi:hypothetical protein